MSGPNAYLPFPGFEYRHEANTDIITWSNRHLPRNLRLFAVFIIVLFVSAPLSLFLTAQLLSDASTITLSGFEIVTSIFFVIVGWGAVVGTSYYLLRLTWTETIKVSNEGISLLYSGLLAPKGKQISERRIWRLSFEKYGHERHQESRFTLNIFYDDHRATLAYWMRNEEIYQLFLLLEQIFNDRDWSFQIKSEYNSQR
jgi:hypothetical protein